MTNIDLYALCIERSDLRNGHTDISVGAIDLSHAAVVETYDFVERVAAVRHLAGVLGRVGAELASHVIDTARRCGCRGTGRCRLGVAGLLRQVHQVLDENDKPVGDQFDLIPYDPLLEFTVPTAVADGWVQRIQDTLAEIVEADSIEFIDDPESREFGQVLA